MSCLLGCEWPPFLTSDPEGGSGQYACWTSMDSSTSRGVQQLHVGCSVAGEIVNRRVCLVRGPRLLGNLGISLEFGDLVLWKPMLVSCNSTFAAHGCFGLVAGQPGAFGRLACALDCFGEKPPFAAAVVARTWLLQRSSRSRGLWREGC